MSQPEGNLDPLARLLRDAVDLDDQKKRVAREDFLRRVDTEAVGSSVIRRRMTWRAAMAAVASAAAAVLVTLFWPSGQLAYEVVGAVDESGYVRVAGNAPAMIQFDDETRLTATPGARLRIVETQRSGAHVSVEEGRIEARVVHGEDSDWRFVAGPFRVRVTGTRFDLTWDTQLDRLEVVLHEGSVEIAASDSGPVAVRAGQRFVGHARQRSMQVTEQGAAKRTSEDLDSPSSDDLEPASGTPFDDEPAEGGAPPPATQTASPEKSLTGGRSRSWPALVSGGEFRRVVEEAEARGTARCLSSCNQSDLVALADAARYTGRSDLAEEALLTLRKRFATTAGNRAAFLLGRLYEHRGRNAQARTWYETSLRESPNGSFASESLAGKMRTVNALEGKEAASAIASEYLRRYPQGVHASVARQLANSP